VFLEPITYLKQQLNKFVEVAFLDAQVVENDLACPIDTLKNRFIE
jgi:hypothetical protein